MYFDKSVQHTQRYNFSVGYSGSELLNSTLNLFADFKDKEMKARDTASSLLKNPKISHDDRRLSEAKMAITENGRLKEQCGVWAHEFRRTPDRKFTLDIGDVSFFKLYNDVEERRGAAKRETWKFTYQKCELIKPLTKKISSLESELGIGNKIKRVLTLRIEEENEIKEELNDCRIMLNCFKRDQIEEIHLGLGDIVYFDLAPLLKERE